MNFVLNFSNVTLHNSVFISSDSYLFVTWIYHRLKILITFPVEYSCFFILENLFDFFPFFHLITWFNHYVQRCESIQFDSISIFQMVVSTITRTHWNSHTKCALKWKIRTAKKKLEIKKKNEINQKKKEEERKKEMAGNTDETTQKLLLKPKLLVAVQLYFHFSNL